MRSARALHLGLYALMVPRAHAHFATIALLLPYGDPSACADAWLLHSTAQAAVAAVAMTPWWIATGLALRLEASAADDTFTAWEAADALATRPLLPCAAATAGGLSVCSVLRLGVVSCAADSDGAEAVSLAARAGGSPLLLAGLAYDDATPSPYTPRSAAASATPVFRAGHTDEEGAGAVLSLIRNEGWLVFAVLASSDFDAQATASAVIQLAAAALQADESGSQPVITEVLSFDGSTNTTGRAAVTPGRVPHTIAAALGTLQAGSARVVILVAAPRDASALLAAAAAVGMTGQGWTWLGLGGWMRETTWRTSATASARDAVAAAMAGALGVEALPLNAAAAFGPTGPPRFDPATIASAPSAAAFFLSVDDLNRTSAAAVRAAVFFPPQLPPTPVSCSSLFGGAALRHGAGVTGFPWDGPAAYMYDAVWSLAAATAAALADPAVTAAVGITAGGGGVSPNVTALRAAVVDALRGVSSVPLPRSPLTGASVAFFANGDRGPPPLLALVNSRDARGDNAPLSMWMSSAVPVPLLIDGTPAYTPAGSGVAGDGSLSAGSWGPRAAPIVWPGGALNTPSDRVVTQSDSPAIAAAMALVGILISQIAGALLRSRRVMLIPESGVTIAVGLATGAVVRIFASPAVQANAAFNPDIFTLVLLPIIIFESGYSLDRRPFFRQLCSIFAFALIGTIITTIIIGLVVFEAGRSGFVLPLSVMEAMTFASLLSATDPVATLAIYGALHVHPTLYALVYGEAVLNDAVAIVLYSTFSGFIVAPATTTAAANAVVSFLILAVASTTIGIAAALAATLVFRFVNVSGVAPRVKRERSLAVRVGILRAKSLSAMHLLHVDQLLTTVRQIPTQLTRGGGRFVQSVRGYLAPLGTWMALRMRSWHDAKLRAHAYRTPTVGSMTPGDTISHRGANATRGTDADVGDRVDAEVSGGTSSVAGVAMHVSGHVTDVADAAASATPQVTPLHMDAMPADRVSDGDGRSDTTGATSSAQLATSVRGQEQAPSTDNMGAARSPETVMHAHISRHQSMGHAVTAGVMHRSGRVRIIDNLDVRHTHDDDVAAAGTGLRLRVGPQLPPPSSSATSHVSLRPSASTDGGGNRNIDVVLPEGAPANTATNGAVDVGAAVVDVTAGAMETGVLLIISYLAFAVAQSAAMSGIVAALTCGIAMNTYTQPVLSEDGRATSRAAFRMLAAIADTAVFFSIGLQITLQVGHGKYDGPLISVTLGAMILGRAAHVFPLAALLNFGRREHITPRFQLAMFHAGLRGAIAFSLALSFPSQNREPLVNATALICIVTIFVLGATTAPLLKGLHIPYGDDAERVMLLASPMGAGGGVISRGLEAFDVRIRRVILGADVMDAADREAAEASRIVHGDAVQTGGDSRGALPPAGGTVDAECGVTAGSPADHE